MGVGAFLYPPPYGDQPMIRPITLAACGLCASLLTLSGASAAPAVKGKPKVLQVRIVTDAHTIGRYTPRAITVHKGGSVLFKNTSNAPHTVSADKGSFDSGLLKIGKSWTFHAKKTGTFTYFC